MSENEKNILIASSVRFYSEYDEDVFFKWLDSISSVDGYRGRGKDLYIHLSTEYLDEESLRDITALFIRYGVDKKQLEKFTL